MKKHNQKQIDLLKTDKQIGFIYIQSTRTNTITTLTDAKGNTKSWVSSGSVGFKNSRKSTSYGAQVATEKLIINAIDLGFTSVRVIMKGVGYGKKSSIRTICKSRLKVTSIEDRTSVPHNGCRLSRKRRV